MEFRLSDHFVVQAEKQVVGIAVRVPGGFRFFTSDPAYKGLETQVFAKARSIDRLAAEIAVARRKDGAHFGATLH
jgi:hypothetical protein